MLKDSIKMIYSQSSFLKKELDTTALIRRAIQSCTWLGLATVLALTIVSQITIRRSRNWVSHTFNVLESVQELEADISKLEVSLNSVLLRSDLSAYIDYQTVLQSARENIHQLRELTQDNPTQARNLEALNQLMTEELPEPESLNEPVKDLQDPKSKAGRRLQLTLRQIHEQAEILSKVEQDLLAERRSKLDQQGLITSSIVVAGILFSGLMFAYATYDRWQLQRSKQIVGQRLESSELQQELSASLLTCRTLTEAHRLLEAFLAAILPHGNGVIFEINNSRDQMTPVVSFGENSSPFGIYSPRECWALRRGEDRLSNRQILKLPCELCGKLSDDREGVVMCIPLQAHEQTLGIFHAKDVPLPIEKDLIALAHQLALPLAVLKLQTDLEYLSVHDSNTGLYNRRFLDEMLQRSAAYADRQNYGFDSGSMPYSVGLIFIDVDHFKRFNTDYGHDTGDLVLRALSQLLKELTREGIDVPCRYGGEEFLLIMPGANLENTLKKAEAIRQKTELLNIVKGAPISISAGVAAYPAHGPTIDRAVKAANVALLRAKAEGRNRVCVAPLD